MNKDRKFEFGLVSRTEQIKILVARIVVFTLAMIFLGTLLFVETDQSTNCYLAGLTMICVFVYINLLQIKLEFEEILEFTFGHKGTEFSIVGASLVTYGFYLNHFS